MQQHLLPPPARQARPSKVGIVNYVDHASLNQIVASVEERLDEVGKEKGVTFDYADYYANAQADQTNLNQIGADLVADGVDVIVAVATPTAATMLAAVEDTDIPVVYSAVTDPAAAGFDTEPNITGTSDALNTDAIMNLILAVNPDIDTIGLLYDLSQDASTQAIADAKAFCDSKGIKYIEKNGTTTAEVQMAAEALIAAGVKAVFTPTDNTVMTAELSIYETFTEAGVQHYTGADSFALNGAFVGYGVDYVQLGEATADMVVELLCDGKTPADLPFQTFDNGIATINTETCEALGPRPRHREEGLCTLLHRSCGSDHGRELWLNLSVIASQCHLPYRGEALAFRKAFSLRQRLPSVGATTTTAASGGNRESLLEPRPARRKCKTRSGCWVPQPGLVER